MTKASEWAARVEAWRASGLSAQKYCAGREYSASTLLWWSSKLGRKGAVGGSRGEVRFARVVQAASSETARTLVVQVGGARVEVPCGTDQATLAAVFEALGISVGTGAR
jgi:transposase